MSRRSAKSPKAARVARGAAAADFRWRSWLVLGALAFLFLMLVARVLALQVLDVDHGADFLKRQGDMRMVRTAELPAYRGLITDRRGEPLAVSTPVISLWANPSELGKQERVGALASALGMKQAELADKLERYQGRQFMYLKRHLVPDQAREVLDLKVPGVYGEREYRRFYPAGEAVGQLVGMTNVDGEGVAGLELAYDEWLRGHPGKKRYIKDLHGDAVRDIGVVEAARPGRNLQLSIDLRLQYLQHQELERAVTITGAEAGVILTLDAYTGEILASASYPDFNPNNRSGVTMSQTRNRAMTDVFEPGSTMKPLTLVAALESGKYTTASIIDTSPGRIRVGRKVFPDPRDYGQISLSRVVEKSSQVGITKVSLSVGHEPVWNVYKRFGLGDSTATGFPGESSGLLPHRTRWRPIEQVTLAFGYGLTATPLQIARAYAVFANGGTLPDVSLLKAEGALPPGNRVISESVAADVRQVLHRVTQEQGTASRAQVSGYAVGGKTGTVHKVGQGGYLDDQYVALFAGIAPIDDPRVVTVVVLDRPKGDAYGGGAAAAPVFARVTGETMRLLGVAPDIEFGEQMLASLNLEGEQ
ncbi:MAG: penicillin-binding protein 2 [Pseudomonadota bacterium]